MRAALVAVVAAPTAGAAAWAALGTRAGARIRDAGRLLPGVAAASVMVALAAGGTVLAGGLTGSSPAVWEFSGEPWRALLAAGALLPLGAVLARASIPGRGARGRSTPAGSVHHLSGNHGNRPEGGSAPLAAAAFAGTAAAAGSVLAGGLVSAAILLPLTTLAFAVAAGALHASGPGAGTAAARAVVLLAASDVAILAGLLLTAGEGLGVPPRPGTAAGMLLLAGACVRLGLLPLAGPVEDAVQAHPATAALALGALRAQGFMLAGWALAAGGSVTHAAVWLGAATAVWGAARALREGSLAAAAAAHAGIVIAALAAGGAGRPAGTLLAAGGFLVWPLVLAGGRWAELARPTLGVWAAGAALPAVGLGLEAGFRDAAQVAPAALLLVAGAALVLVAGAFRLRIPFGAEPPAATRAAPLPVPPPSPAVGAPRVTPAAWWWAAPAAVAALGVAILPLATITNVARPAAAALGSAGILQPAEAVGLPNDAGILMVGVGAASLMAAYPSGRGGPAARERPPPRWTAWWGAAARLPAAGSATGRWRADRAAGRALRAAAVVWTFAAGAAVWLYAVGVARGFL